MSESFFTSLMNKDLDEPPLSKDLLTPPQVLVERLKPLIGMHFELGATRTNGARMRKLVANVLEQYPQPLGASPNSYTKVNKKGLPSILREYIDTYIVTSRENTYNLQVWNRNPSSKSIQIEYVAGEPLYANDARIVLVRVDRDQQYIRCVLVLTPEYITRHFGKFGKETKKYQLMIAPKTRKSILQSEPPLLFYPDTQNFSFNLAQVYKTPHGSMRNFPVMGEVMSLEMLRDKLAPKLIGVKLDVGATATKNRGQALELLVAQYLDYKLAPGEQLLGNYPDIPNQVLEVKVQDSPTVDLGKYSPEFEEVVPNCIGASTRDIRYIIALTEEVTGVIKGLILCPGAKLGDQFTYVADKSYKCQRSIPIKVFDDCEGQVLFNPGEK